MRRYAGLLVTKSRGTCQCVTAGWGLTEDIGPCRTRRSPGCATKDGPILDVLSGYRPAMAKLGEVWVSSGLVRLLTRIFALDVLRTKMQIRCRETKGGPANIKRAICSSCANRRLWLNLLMSSA